MLWLLLYIVIFVLSLHIIINYSYKARKLAKLPGPKGLFFFGDIITVMRQTPVGLIKLLRDMAEKNSGIYKFWTFPFAAVNIYTAKDIEIVLSNMKYIKKSIIYRILRPWLRDGLLLSEGTKWQERRKILTSAFHFNILLQFLKILNDNSHRLIEKIEKVAGKPVDVLHILSEFTLNSICETAMGTQLSKNASAKSYRDAIYSLGFVFFQRIRRLYLVFDFMFELTPTGRKQMKYLKTVHGFTRKIIKERKEYMEKHGHNIHGDIDDDQETCVHKQKKKTAMLDLLLTAQKDGLIDDVGIQEEVDTFMFEGHDTTASGLTFCLMLLANNKDVQDKIYEELKEIFGDTKRYISMDDISNMKYLERCIKESLRLYPPVPFISRHLQDTTFLSNYEIPANTLCHVHIYDLHRRPDQFKDPEKFDPDRFLPENSVGRHPYAYIPFSAGPRNCIGQRFAMMEMKIAVANVLWEFELEPITRPSDIVMITDLVLRNNGPVNVTFIKRS